MTVRNLDALFAPKAIALIGASNQPGSVGSVLARNLFGAVFACPILPVNPHEQAIRSTVNYRTPDDLPLPPDLAVVATPPATVPGIIDQLGRKGCRAAVVVTAGFGEGDRSEGEELRRAALAAARPHLLRIIGPNCLGFISPGAGINASFAQLTPRAGDIAFVTQSGAIATTVLDWAAPRGIGFSHVISVGDMIDVDFGDLLDYLAVDQATHAILLYIENVTHARKFMSAARAAARAKPVIVIKSGRSTAGAKAALSHTGALAGADYVYDAAFRRAGMLRVHELRELFEAVTTLASGMNVRDDRLAILTNGGGVGVLATDALEEGGGRLAALSPETIAALDKLLPPAWSRANPVDILGDASRERYGAAMATLISDPGLDAILVMNCPTAVAASIDAAEAVVATLGQGNKVPILTCWLGEESAAGARTLFSANRIPAYDTPDEAVRAFMHLVRYRRNQELLFETPPNELKLAAVDAGKVRGLLDRARASGRTMLSEPEAKTVLAAYGIPVTATRSVATPAEAARAAAEIGGPVVLKILSPDITHKSDVGGVRLDLDTPAAVERAAADMLATVQAAAPEARIDGFVVEQMVRRSQAHELLLGVAHDRTFGPILLFGQGGTAAEVIGDRAIGLPPLNTVLAREMISATRIARLLKGYRERPPADIDAVVRALLGLSQLVVDFSEIAELDVNPLLVDDKGALALDARIVLHADGVPGERLAIRAYPQELQHDLVLGKDRFVIRAIRPEDETALSAMLRNRLPEDTRLRIFGSADEIPHAMTSRVTQIDYGREMTLVAIPFGRSGIDGLARLASDPDNETAEFACIVAGDARGRGLGRHLMTDLLAYARKRGIRTVWSDVPGDNQAILQMASELGFAIGGRTAAGFRHVALNLR
ncbi:MAG TPA: bifunctional acetate--CoA ligase family protein/GNAT family N-acetyltransferase [Bauldia sp.]|nr:bifunctional acetate--CoA ligase family protein/GNAT family N-acetyltransferase [Bauldia sp.]